VSVALHLEVEVDFRSLMAAVEFGALATRHPVSQQWRHVTLRRTTIFGWLVGSMGAAQSSSKLLLELVLL